MKEIIMTVGCLLVMVTMIITPVAALDFDSSFLLLQDRLPLRTEILQSVQIPTDEPIIIEEVENFDPSSALTSGANEMVITYVKTDKNEVNSIYAAVILNDGLDLYKYKVSNHLFSCDNPAIGYVENGNFYIITYECNQKDIYAQLFSPSTETIGPMVQIANNDLTIGYPSIACNQAISSCLIAFQYNHNQIKGRYIDVDSSGINLLGDLYDLSDASFARKPYLVWGKNSGTYLVAYDEQLGSGEFIPGFTHVHDHYDSSLGQKFYHSNTSALPSEFSPYDYDASVTDITFDPCTQKYLVLYEYDTEGDKSNIDLWAAIIHETDPINMGVFSIADSLENEHSGAISFISAVNHPAACGAMDKLVVAYVNTAVGVMTVELRGNDHTLIPNYSVDPVEQHLLIQQKASSFELQHPMITNEPTGTELLIAYERYWIASGDYDILGRYIHIQSQLPYYLPLVMR